MAPKISVLGRFTADQIDALEQVGTDRVLWVALNSDTALIAHVLSGSRGSSEIGVFFPPFWNGNLARLAEDIGRVGGHCVVSAQVLRSRRTEVIASTVDVFAEPLQFDDEVEITIEAEIDQLNQSLAELYIAVGVGSGADLPALLDEGDEYPDRDYLTRRSLERLARKYAVHWGGNLPLDRPQWMIENFPAESRGFFVTSSNAFPPGSPNHADLSTLDPDAIPAAVRSLRSVCAGLGTDRSGNQDQ